MVKPIILHDVENGVDYTLEFNKDSVKFAESHGFYLGDLERFPMTKIYELFFYAFRMHHKNVAREKTDKFIDEYWGGVGGIPEGVITRLGELYSQPFESTVDDTANPRLTVEM